MTLGRREARHQTVAAAKVAVDSSLWWDFKPGQRVMTIDGFPGHVQAVLDGPTPGNEAYEVKLENDMGGGLYTSSQLRETSNTTASVEHTAADDYPELGTILQDRPDIANNTVLSSMGQFHAQRTQDGDEDSLNPFEAAAEQTSIGLAPEHGGYGDYTENSTCPDCGGSRMLSGVDITKCENCGYIKATAAMNDQKASECRACGDDLPSTTGTVDCPSCGTEHQFQKAAGAQTHDAETYPTGATCKDCGFAHRDATPGSECLLCGGQMSRHPDKFAAASFDPYSMLVEAAQDMSFRFHVTASWADVRAKAKRLREKGHVQILAAHGSILSGNVKGDHGIYETTLQQIPGRQAIATWQCGCKWASYSWGRSGRFKRFEGRMCSHALALQFEAQSRGMFGREVTEDEKSPQWLKPRSRIVTEWDKDNNKNISRPATPRKRDLQRTYSSLDHGFEVQHLAGVDGDFDPSAAPIEFLVVGALLGGEPEDEVRSALRIAGLTPEGLLAEAKKKVKHRHHLKRKHERQNPGGRGSGYPYGAWWHGLGYGGYCGQCDGGGCGHCGGSGYADGSGADAGGDSGGDGGSEGVVHAPTPVLASHDDSAFEPGEPTLTGGLTQMLALADDLDLDFRGMNDEQMQTLAWGAVVPIVRAVAPKLIKTVAPMIVKRVLRGGQQAQPQQVPPGLSGQTSTGVPMMASVSPQPAPVPQAPAEPDEQVETPESRKAAHEAAIARMEAEQHSVPQGALPTTDGTEDEDSLDTPADTQVTGSVADIVAQFQATAGQAIMQGGGAGGGAPQAAGDVAAYAKEFLAKTALKDFTPAEQQAIINEGVGTTASNMDRLNITGTHYEALDAARASTDDDEELFV